MTTNTEDNIPADNTDIPADIGPGLMAPPTPDMPAPPAPPTADSEEPRP